MNTHRPRWLLLRRSGQLHRFLGSFYAFIIGLVGLGVLSDAAGALPSRAVLMATTFLCLLMVGGAFIATQAVCCPQCREKWLLWSMASKPFTEWLNWMAEAEACPRCGYGADRPAAE